jgi:DNA repair exonuclease SbcCD ATPase subunit
MPGLRALRHLSTKERRVVTAPLPLADQSWPRRARQLTKIYVRCFRYALAARAREAELVSARKALADTIRQRDKWRDSTHQWLAMERLDAQRIDLLEDQREHDKAAYVRDQKRIDALEAEHETMQARLDNWHDLGDDLAELLERLHLDGVTALPGLSELVRRIAECQMEAD